MEQVMLILCHPDTARVLFGEPALLDTTIQYYVKMSSDMPRGLLIQRGGEFADEDILVGDPCEGTPDFMHTGR